MDESVISGCYPWMKEASIDGGTSSMDESVIGGCHPWMEKPHPWMRMTNDGYGGSNNHFARIHR